jgi:hypothetical protein
MVSAGLACVYPARYSRLAVGRDEIFDKDMGLKVNADLGIIILFHDRLRDQDLFSATLEGGGNGNTIVFHTPTFTGGKREKKK